MWTERDQLKKLKEEYTTCIPGTVVCSKESTAQHDTAPQRRARHGTARRCGTLQGYIQLGWAEVGVHCDYTP